MTVSELIVLLKNFPENSEVLITNELVDNENLDIARVEGKRAMLFCTRQINLKLYRGERDSVAE